MSRKPKPHTWAMRGYSAVLLAAGIFTAPPGTAALLPLSSIPLSVANTTKPNIMYTLDNSGSMDWPFMPDQDMWGPGSQTGVDTSTGTFHHCYKNSIFNDVYYDPTETYLPGVTSTGTAMPNASFTAAPLDPYASYDGGSTTATLDLATSFDLYGSEYPYYYYDAYYFYNWGWIAYQYPNALNPQPAYYYNYTGSGTPQRNYCYPDSDYTKVVVSATSGPGGTDERQNFANWFSYYRTRVLTTKSSLGAAFSGLTSQYRVGFSTINDNNGNPNTSGDNFLNVLDFTASQKSAWFQDLYAINPVGGTPLQQALENDGKYYQTGSMPGANGSIDPIQESCQLNFTVLSTDGFWNAPFSGIGDQDNTIPTLPDPVSGLTAGNQWPNPYWEGATATSNTLADVAMYYWDHDLRTSGPLSTDNVPTSQQDPAPWQHMDTFTVGLGAQGIVTPTTYQNIVAGTAQWPVPQANQLTTIDDLWHAGVNGHGSYLSAKNPASLSQGLRSILSTITDMTSAYSAVALDQQTPGPNNNVYQATFSSADWSGSLYSYPILANNTLGTASWNAGAVLNSQNFDTGRAIITYDPNTTPPTGIPFRWANLDPTLEQTPLNTNALGVADGEGPARVNWLRGDTSQAGTGLGFRQRNTSVLGDIVNSSLTYVGAPSYNYPASLEPAPYSTFAASNAHREGMLYVGANDGMLHGFDATTGQEKIAYVPTSVYPNLSLLTDPAYTHHWYVDGSPTTGDVYYNGAWHTVLVGGLGGGGQGVYALDVTNPLAFSEANAASLALWEFTDTNDADLGYTYAQPAIALMANGDWAAIISNGYNNTQSDAHVSATGHAVLYVLDIQTGHVLAKIDTGVGTVTSPDGLSQPTPVDVNGDDVADAIYAGDIDGNMWKFDVTSSNPAQWKVAYSSHGKPAPLYSAVDGAGNPQPITTAPQVGIGPTIAGVSQGEMVYFGTGSYFQTGDISNTSQQTMYGIWDNGAIVPNRVTNASALVQQTITNVVTQNGVTYRVVSNNPVNYSTSAPPDGWYIDLTVGERSVSNSTLINTNLIFNTITPSTTVCSYGGVTWQMDINAMTGGSLATSAFDVNGDGAINAGDALSLPGGGSASASGMELHGIYSAPVIQEIPGTGTGLAISNGSGTGSGGPNTGHGTQSGGTTGQPSNGMQINQINTGAITGKVSWEQLQ